MPYIITTWADRPHMSDPAARVLHVQSRHAVATLDDAQRAVAQVLADANGQLEGLSAQVAVTPAERGEADDAITTDGGTIGPLPDRTVIEVEPISWIDFGQRYGHHGGGWRDIDAFNAAVAS